MRLKEQKVGLKLGAHCAIYNSPLRLLLVRLYEHDPHVTLWDLSCPICQTVRQSRRVKHINPYAFGDCELHYTRD